MNHTDVTETILVPQRDMSPWERLMAAPVATRTDNQSAGRFDFGSTVSTILDTGCKSSSLKESRLKEQYILQLTIHLTTLNKLLLETKNVSVPPAEQVLRDWYANSTSPDYESIAPEEIFQELFVAARDEIFEDGMESNFSRKLSVLIEEHKDQAIYFAEEYLDSEEVDEEVASELLRQLGHSGHEPTYRSRLNLLVQGLSSESAMVRDGAILGLASMDDPGVIPEVKEAVKREKDPELRDDMHAVLEQLRTTLTEA